MRRFLALLLAACLGLALTGCLEEGPLPSSTQPPDPTPTPSPTQPAEAARFSLGYDSTATLNPLSGDNQVNRELAGLVYQGLYELDNQFLPNPVLAVSGVPAWDGYSWTFTLNTGALFSDGTPFTAQHAAASLNTARAGGPYAGRLSGITGAAAVDDATLVVYLSAPNGNLPALLDVPIILEREDAPAPLGTGYYQYESSGDRMFLQVNPYNRSAAALPYTTIPLTTITGADERIASFDSGEVTAVTTEFFSAYALGYSSSYETCDYPTTTLLFVGFRAAGGPCQSAGVRQAFSRAIDRDSVVQTLLSGHADPACLPVSPLCGDYDGEAAAQLDYDLEAAAQLLADAGYSLSEEDGLLYRRRVPLEVTLLVNSDNESRQTVADAIAASLAGLGVSVTVNSLSWSNYTAALAAGQFDLYIGEVKLTGDFNPSPLLTGSLNYGGYENWALTQALGDWKAAWGEARPQAAKVLWEQFVQDAPIAPVCFKRGSMLVRWGMVSGLQPTRANPFYRMEEWTTALNR